MTQRDSSTIILFLTPHFRNSKFLTPHSLMFNTSRATYALSPLATTRYYVPSLSFVKVLNQNLIWYHFNCTHHISHIFQSSLISYQWTLDRLQNLLVFLFTTHFDHSSIFDSPTFLIKNFLPSDPHIFKRSVSWMPSLSTYLGSVSCLTQFILFQHYIWPCGN